MVMLVFDYKRFERHRNEALLSLDEDKIRAYACMYGIEMPHDERFWIAVHKARCEILALPKEARDLSRDWLIKNGHFPGIGMGERRGR